MGHNPYLDAEMKRTVQLCMAMVLYHTERISKSVYSISKPARELRELPAHDVWGTLNLMTAKRIAGNRHWCDRCMMYFSSRYNLDRHMKRINACHFNDNSAIPRKIVDVLTGKLRYRTLAEQHELASKRKLDSYWDIQ